ncbi:MAG: efflux RND transporter permease subunit [Acidobacteriia bacterium]|nr:efflux RND transporter permease subunit [Terriglobia bacterium]
MAYGLEAGQFCIRPGFDHKAPVRCCICPVGLGTSSGCASGKCNVCRRARGQCLRWLERWRCACARPSCHHVAHRSRASSPPSWRSIRPSRAIRRFKRFAAARGFSASESALRGALVRLRRVLTTALVASLGFIPMSLATSSGAEVQRPLAAVVIRGLVASTLPTPLVLPSIYARVEGRAE